MKNLGVMHLLALFLVAANATAAPRIKLDEHGVPLTAPEGVVDRVAYGYQKDAVIKVEKLLSTTKNPEQRAKFLVRLSQLQQKQSDIAFRIAHSDAYKAKKPINLEVYKKLTKVSIGTMNAVIKEFPSHREIPNVFLMRAKAFQEIDNKQAANDDYHYIETHFPNFEGIKAVYLEVAEMAEERGDYVTEIKYLHRLESEKKDVERYTYALYKLAWAFYRLDQIDQSMNYVKTHTRFQNELMKRRQAARGGGVSERIRRDDLLKDSATFYMRGYELKMPQYRLAATIPYFAQLASGPGGEEPYREMIVRFTRLLRAQAKSAELTEWKQEVIRALPDREESLEVVMIAFEDELNKYRWADLAQSVNTIIALHGKSGKLYSFKSAELLLIDSASKIQGQIVKAKEKDAGIELTGVLEKVYKGVLEMADNKAVSSIRIRYNLAEALAGLGKDQEAIEHYKWIFQSGSDADKALTPAGVGSVDAGIKAAGLIYEQLKKKKVIPTDLTPMPLDTPPQDTLDAQFTDWLGLIGQLAHAKLKADQKERISYYVFESNRAFYAQGHVQDAIARMRQFSDSFIDTPHAIPAARLVVDTLIASKRWDEVEATCAHYAAQKGWKDPKFPLELAVIASDASYKIIESKYAAADYKGVLAHAEDYLKRYPTSKRKEDVLSLIGKSAIALNNDKVAREYVTKIIDEAPNSKYFDSAVFLRGSLNERQFQYAGAKADYEHYLDIMSKRNGELAVPKEELHKKLLVFAWISGDSDALLELLENKQICDRKLEILCDQYRALALFEQGKPSGRHWFIKSSAPNRALWTLVELGAKNEFTLNERLFRMTAVAETWTDVDPMVRLALVSRVTSIMARNIAKVREEVQRSVKVKANPKVISWRVDGIKHVENFAAKIVKLPIARVQVTLMNEVANLYTDLASDIRAIPAPKGLQEEEMKVYAATMTKVASPFDEMGHKIRLGAYERASQGGVEAEVFQEVANLIAKEDPGFFKGLVADGQMPVAMAMTPRMLDDFDMVTEGADSPNKKRMLRAAAQGRQPSGDQVEAANQYEVDAHERLRDEWLKAIQSKRWAMVSYLLQDARKRQFVRAGILEVMESISLALAGAQSEGLGSLDGARLKFKGEERARVAWAMTKFYFGTLAKDKVVKLLKSVDTTQMPGGLFNEHDRIVLSQWTGDHL